MKFVEICLREIATYGLPPLDEKGKLYKDYEGRVAFIYLDVILSGFPIVSKAGDVVWYTERNIGSCVPYAGVTHWVEFPRTLSEL